ncbi:MAG: folate family ECF transporter S component [Cellulosilyticum sp.]|nr:folate family ECF transporter S component [Cellulosilyticum sp.]
MNKTFTIKRMALFALLLALKIILSRITGISFGIVKLTFGFIATGLTGYLFGPYLTCLAGGITDLMGFFLFPQGTYFPGYTLTSMITGFIYGVILYKKKPTFLRILSAVALEAIICSLLLNTLWTSILFGKAFFAILPARITKNLLAIPLQTCILSLIFKYLQKSLKQLLLIK